MKIHFPKMYWKRPDPRAWLQKLKSLTWQDVKESHRRRKARRREILEARRNSPFAKKMQPVYGWMNRFSLPLQFLWACVLNFLIEVISRHSFLEAWDYMTGTPLVFLYNAFLIAVTFSLVYLFHRRVFVRILLSVFWLALGVTNGYMLLKRVTPFNAQDLKVLSDGVTLINQYFKGFELVLLAVGVLAVVVWVISMWRRGGQYQGKLNRPLALVGIALWVGGYFLLTDLALDHRVLSNYFGNVAFAYQDYGFPYCFASSLLDTGIDEPPGYSKETMEALSEENQLTRVETSLEEGERPNILFIQLESLVDPTEIESLEFSQDPIPNLRSLFQSYSSGYFKVPSVGAGTANTEFEVLTGMSMRFFGPGEYPYKTYAKTHTLESAATALGALGYGTEALHNNGGNFYSRADVFNNMGFDHFTSEEFMNILQLTPNGWATDDVLVSHILESMDTTPGQDFVFAISVQGHGAYPEEKVLENPSVLVSGVEDEGERNAWEYYVNMVHAMDAFVGNLIRELEARGEPTVAVFYGDHLPTMGLKAGDMKSRYLYNTNYVIWDNIGLEKEDKNLSAYQIMAEVFGRLDIHSGTVFNYHQSRRRSKDYLADLELLQYDLLYGDQYVYEGQEPPITEGHMVMGVKDVYVTELVTQMDGTYSLYGGNFTRNSRVYRNGERISSTFMNNTRIDLRGVELQEGDRLEISQVGSRDTVFRTSPAYVYQGGALVQVTEETSADTTEEAVP